MKAVADPGEVLSSLYWDTDLGQVAMCVCARWNGARAWCCHDTSLGRGTVGDRPGEYGFTT
jgi:hypothetical protein